MRSLPHGWYSVVVVIFAASGWFASLWEGDSCNYAIVTGPIVNQLDPSYTSKNPITTLQLGFNSYRELPTKDLLPAKVAKREFDDDDSVSNNIHNNNNNEAIAADLTDHAGPTISMTNLTDALLPDWSKNRTAGCIDYPDTFVKKGIVDGNWETATGFAFLGLVLGGAGTTFLCCSLCFVFSRVTWRWTAYELLLAGFCQTISLVAWFQTQLCSWNDCGWSKGSISDLVAVGLWTIAGLLMVCNYPSWNHLQQDNCSKNTVVHDHRSDDGSLDSLDLEQQQTNGQGEKGTGNVIHRRRLPQHSYEDDEDCDKRRFPQAEIA